MKCEWIYKEEKIMRISNLISEGGGGGDVVVMEDEYMSSK